MIAAQFDAESIGTHQFVFLSVIYGAAVAVLMAGVGRLISERARVRSWWLTWLWILVIGLQIAQNWWVMWDWSGLVIRDFMGFIIVGGVPLTYCLLAALVVPMEVPPEGVDLREHYFRQARPLFLLGATVVALLQVIDWEIVGFRSLTVLHAVRLGVILSMVALAFTRKVLVHAVVSVLLLLISIAWIALVTFSFPTTPA